MSRADGGGREPGRQRPEAGAGAPAGGRSAASPGAALLRRNLRRPRELLRKLIVGEALGERPGAAQPGPPR